MFMKLCMCLCCYVYVSEETQQDYITNRLIDQLIPWSLVNFFQIFKSSLSLPLTHSLSLSRLYFPIIPTLPHNPITCTNTQVIFTFISGVFVIFRIFLV